jgi:hypothetical protein
MRKLLLKQAVNALNLLFFAQTNRKFRKTRARLTMCARRIVASLDRAFVRVAALTLKEEL